MRRAPRALRFVPAVVVLATAAAAPVAAQTQQAAAHDHGAAPAFSKTDIEAFAKLEVAIGTARDTTQARLALLRNKKDEVQKALRDSLVTQITGILKGAGMTEADYKHKLFYVSTDSAARRVFDETVAKLTGAPLPGQIAAAPVVKVPAGEIGSRIGRIVNSATDTPDKKSLYATAEAEARTAAQHAALGARQPGNLDALKLHAGHVINALEPALQPMGPGLGYGLKRAATEIASNIDAAAAQKDASTNVKVHSQHISGAAKSTLSRVEAAIGLAQRIQSSTSATDAASLMNQLVSITSQLQPGFDTNSDGRIGWQEPEGGLQAISDHVKLLLAGENIP